MPDPESDATPQSQMAGALGAPQQGRWGRLTQFFGERPVPTLVMLLITFGTTSAASLTAAPRVFSVILLAAQVTVSAAHALVPLSRPWGRNKTYSTLRRVKATVWADHYEGRLVLVVSSVATIVIFVLTLVCYHSPDAISAFAGIVASAIFLGSYSFCSFVGRTGPEPYTLASTKIASVWRTGAAGPMIRIFVTDEKVTPLLDRCFGEEDAVVITPPINGERQSGIMPALLTLTTVACLALLALTGSGGTSGRGLDANVTTTVPSSFSSVPSTAPTVRQSSSTDVTSSAPPTTSQPTTTALVRAVAPAPVEPPPAKPPPPDLSPEQLCGWDPEEQLVELLPDVGGKAASIVSRMGWDMGCPGKAAFSVGNFRVLPLVKPDQSIIAYLAVDRAGHVEVVTKPEFGVLGHPTGDSAEGFVEGELTSPSLRRMEGLMVNAHPSRTGGSGALSGERQAFVRLLYYRNGTCRAALRTLPQETFFLAPVSVTVLASRVAATGGFLDVELEGISLTIKAYANGQVAKRTGTYQAGRAGLHQTPAQPATSATDSQRCESGGLRSQYAVS